MFIFKTNGNNPWKPEALAVEMHFPQHFCTCNLKGILMDCICYNTVEREKSKNARFHIYDTIYFRLAEKGFRKCPQ